MAELQEPNDTRQVQSLSEERSCYDIELSKGCASSRYKFNQFSEQSDVKDNYALISKGNIELDRPSNIDEREIDNVTICEDSSEKVCCTMMSNIQVVHKDCSRSSNKEPTRGSQTSFKDGDDVSRQTNGRKHSRGDDVNRLIDGPGTALGQSNFDLGKRSSNDSVKRERDCQDTTLSSDYSYARKSCSKTSDVNREGACWDWSSDQINSTVLKRHKRDGSSYKEMDACGAPSDQTDSHHQNCSSKNSYVHSEKDGRDTVIELTDPGSWKKDNVRNASAKKVTTEWNGNKETDGWDKPIEKTGSGTWNCHNRDSNFQKEIDGWGKAIEVTVSDPLKKHITESNDKKENSGWGKAYGKGVPDSRQQHGRDWSASKEVGAEGLSMGKTSRDSWKCNSRDGNSKRDTERWSKHDGSSRSRMWKRHVGEGNIRTTDVKGTDWLVSPPKQTSTDPWKHHRGDGNSKWETDGCSKEPGQTRPTALKIQNQVSSVSRGTEEWGSSSHDNVNRETEGCGQVLDHKALVALADQSSLPNMNTRADGSENSPYACEKQIKDGNAIKEINGWVICAKEDDCDARTCEDKDGVNKVTNGSKTIKQAAPVAGESQSKDGNVNQVTDGSGTDFHHLNPGSRDGYVKGENAGWGTSLNQPCSGTWEHLSKDSFVKRETGGCGISCHISGPDALKREHGDGNDKGGGGGWGKTVKSGPDAWACSSRAGNIKKENTEWGANPRNTSVWDHGSRGVHIQKEGDVSDKGGTAGWSIIVKSGPEAWECSSRGGDVKKENTGWGEAPKNTSAFNRGSRGFTVQSENDGRGNSIDGDLKKENTAWGSSRDGNLKKKNAGWGGGMDCNLKKEKNEWGAATSAWDRGGRGVNVRSESDGWGNNKDGDLKKENTERDSSRDGNLKKENAGWGGSIDGNLKKESDGWGDSKDGDLKKENTEWGSSRDCNLKKENAGWGGSIDGNHKKENDGWGIKYGNVKKEDNAWGSSKNGDVKEENYGCRTAPVNNISDAWNRGGRDVNIQSERNGWGTALKTSSSDVWNHSGRVLKARRETDGSGKALSEEGRDPCKIDRWGAAPDREGHDSWKRHNLSTSKELCWDNKRRSRSPPRFDRWSGRGKMVPRASGEVCWNFAAGRCRRGSQCKFLHEENVPKDVDGSMTEIKENRFGSTGYSGSGSKKDFRGSWDTKNCPQGKISDRSPDRFDSQEKHELHRAKTSSAPCFNFLRGRCDRGSGCKYLHKETPDGVGSEIRTYDDRCGNNQTKNSTPPWNGPCWDEQTAGMNVSNSSQWTCGDVAKLTGACSMDVGDPTQVQFRQAQSVTSKLQGHLEISKDGLMGDLLQPSEACFPKHFGSLSASSHPIINVELKEKLQNVDKESTVEPLRDTGKEEKTTAVNKKDSDAHTVAVGFPTDGENNVGKDEKEIKKFKFALADYVKDILKPHWKKGNLSKEAHKIIVKKVVEKVISVLPRPNIPRNQKQISIYLSYSEVKLTTLVKDYVERYAKNEPVLEKD